jgi:hypothetical protein
MINSCPLDANWGREIFIDIHDCNWKELDTLGLKPIPDENSCKLHYTGLNNKLGSIYKNWKASGNGDNQVAAPGSSLEEADFGTVDLETLPTQGGDRIGFLGNYNICVMYLWFSLIKAGAFLYSQTEFPSAFQADDGIAPKITKSVRAATSIGSSGGSTSSKSSCTHNKKVAIAKVETEIEAFSHQIDRLNNSMLLDSRLDHLIAAKRDLKSELHELMKEIDALLDKKHMAELDFESEQVEKMKVLKKEYRDRWRKRYAEAERSALLKEKQIEELENKEKIIESKLYEIKDKTPKPSGNSSKQGSRVVPSSIVITDDIAEENRLAGLINFDTPAVATTPTATSTQINTWRDLNNKGKRSEEKEETPESANLLAQETPPDFDDDDEDDDDDELFKKVL